MNYDIHIENLGAIEKADITITPLTILAGENGTGKSFVTKFFYSILNIISYDFFYTEIKKNLDDALEYTDKIQELLKRDKHYENDLNKIILIRENLKDLSNEWAENSDTLRLLDLAKRKDKKIIRLIETYEESSLNKLYRDYKDNQSNETFMRSSTSSGSVDTLLLVYNTKILSSNLGVLKTLISHPEVLLEHIFEYLLEEELKRNFQISTIDELINFNSDYLLFEVKNLLSVKIERNSKYKFSFNSGFFLKDLYRTIFFESPVYWRLSSNLEFKGNKNEQYLTGIPKHFLDLKELLFANFKKGERPDFIIECANQLQKQLQGKFNASNGDLTFENNQGHSISKSLVSFGMTNLGILQAVLSKNIINKGSFVFIDEPESNLHPEWQAILANVLVKLAQHGVYVIVTTHSSDMLKAFEISTQEQSVEDDLSTYYFQPNGRLLEMDDDALSPIEQARKKLLETYENLMIRGYLL